MTDTEIEAAFVGLAQAQRKVVRNLISAERAIHDVLEFVAALDAHATPRGPLRRGHSRYREALRAVHAARLELQRDSD